KNKTRANIKIATLNMKGGATMGMNDKWNQINHQITNLDLAILAVQETHLDRKLISRLDERFGKNLAFHHSTNPDGRRAEGISVIINRAKLPAGAAKAIDIIPGQAMLVSVPWRKNLKINLLAVYAPTGAGRDNEQFWRLLASKWDEPGGELPPVNVLLGDFNVVERQIDRLPARNDREASVEALGALKLRLGVSDAWRLRHPEDKMFTFTQDHMINPSSSRIDRIYLDDTNIDRASDWEAICMPNNMSDHLLIKTKISLAGTAQMGSGRWSLPLYMLENKKFMERTKKRGAAALKTLQSENFNRSDRVNPQSVFREFTSETARDAKMQSRLSGYKLQTLIRNAQKSYNQELNRQLTAPDSDEAIDRLEALDAIKQRINSLESLAYRRRTTAGSANYRAWGEELNSYW
ncbi:DNase I-like protein, partial [Clavulina sp. PMI_390]